MATLSTPTLDDLILEVRALINQPNPDNSWVSNDELVLWLNEAIRRYFAELVTNSEGQFATTANLNIVANADSISLPSDCFSVRVLWRTTTAGYISCRYIQGAAQASYSTLGDTGGDGYIPSYYIRGNNIILRPVPAFSETSGLKLEYIQFPTTLVDSGDSISTQVSPVFRDLIIAYAAYKAKLRQSGGNIDLVSFFKQNLEDLFRAFKDSVTPRSDYPQYVIPFNPEEM